MTKQTRNFWVEVVLLVLIVGSIAVAIIASEAKPLTAKDVQLTVSDLRSFAAAGQQLIAQHQAGQLTQNFFSAQIQLLEEKIDSSRQTLIGSDAQPEAKQSQRMAGDLAAQIGAAINEVENSPASESSSAPRLASLENRARELEERLKHE